MIPQIGVRVLTRGEPGELSDPVIKWTKPSSPGSEPRNLQIIPTNSTAAVKWTPPTIPNGKINFYQVITTEIYFSKLTNSYI